MHYIFLVHGMGNGWTEDAEEIVKRHYKKESYGFLADSWPFDKYFKLETVDFNAVFEEYLAQAKEQGDKLEQWPGLKGGLQSGLINALGRIVDLAKTDPNKNNFAVTHLADVALYMATNLGELVKNEIMKKMTTYLAEQNFSAKRGDKWSVIAHSLGTRVMTDVLHLGFSTQPGLRNYGKAEVLMMVANVSKLLQELPPWSGGNVYETQVYPSAGPLGACWNFINATHTLDPFAIIHEFDPPPDFGDGYAFIDQVYHGMRLAMADTTSKEVHSFEHYMEHPDVHTALFRYLVSRKGKAGPTNKEMEEARRVYRLNTLGAELTKDLREKLDALKQPWSDKYEDQFAAMFDIWEEYGELIK